MGLLDFAFPGDEQSARRLGMGLLAIGPALMEAQYTPPGMPAGAAIGRGLGQGLQNYAAMQNAETQNQFREMQMAQIKQGMEDKARQAEARRRLLSRMTPMVADASGQSNPSPQSMAEIARNPANFPDLMEAYEPLAMAVLQSDLKSEADTTNIKEYEFARKGGYTGTFPEFIAAKQRQASGRFSNSPQHVQRADGSWALYQTHSDGGGQEVTLPPGYKVFPPTYVANTGTAQTVINKPGGGVVNVVPIDNRGKAADEQRGKDQAEAMAKAPQIIQSADSMLARIADVENHPGLKWSTGWTSPLTMLPGTPMRDVKSRLDQLKGSAFLEAFNQLRGGGQITQVEGEKATQAIARLDLALTEKDFREALKDLRDVIEAGRRRAMDSLTNPTYRDKDGNIVPPVAPARPAQGGWSIKPKGN